MDHLFGIMCDVAGLVTHGSDKARMEARRIAEARTCANTRKALSATDQRAGGAETERRRVPLREWLKVAFVPR